MSDYLADVLSKTLRPQAVVLPRLPGQFEPWPEMGGVAMPPAFSREETGQIRQPHAAGEDRLALSPGGEEGQPRQPMPATSSAPAPADMLPARIQAAAVQPASREQPHAQQLPSPEQIVSRPVRSAPAEQPVAQRQHSSGEADLQPARAVIPEQPAVRRQPSPENMASAALRVAAPKPPAPSEPVGSRHSAAVMPAVAPEEHIVQRHGEERPAVVEHTIERTRTLEPPAPRLQSLMETPALRSSQVKERDAKAAATVPEAHTLSEHVQPPAVAETPPGRRRATAAIIVQPKPALLQPREPAPALERETHRPAPAIQVTIGRIEVRAVQPAPTPTRQTRATTVLSLEEYLRQRRGGAT